MLPNTIKGALESPVVCDLVLEVGKAAVSRLIELELVKLAAAVSVGGSLDNYKVQLIATQMVEFFPNESIADFKVCFFRASAGQYGDIFRLDGIIVRKFMEKYLEEKYQVIEENLMKQKDNLHEVITTPKGPSFDLVKYFKEVNGIDKLPGEKIPAMTREHILEQGQSEPPRKKSTGAQPMTQEEVEAWYRSKYPNATDEQIQSLIYTGKL